MQAAVSPGADDPRRFQHPVLRGVPYPAPGTPAWILQEARLRALKRVREAEDRVRQAEDRARAARERVAVCDLKPWPGKGRPLVVRRRHGGGVVVTFAGQTVEVIARAVAEHHRLTLDDLKGESKNREVAWPRQQAMYIARELGFSFAHIGRVLGGRDHTTIITGYRAVAGRLHTHPSTLAAVTAIRLRLAGAA